jgi:hypothetical protein
MKVSSWENHETNWWIFDASYVWHRRYRESTLDRDHFLEGIDSAWCNAKALVLRSSWRRKRPNRCGFCRSPDDEQRTKNWALRAGLAAFFAWNSIIFVAFFRTNPKMNHKNWCKTTPRVWGRRLAYALVEGLVGHWVINPNRTKIVYGMYRKYPLVM